MNLKNKIKNLIYIVLGVFRFTGFKNRSIILMYHSITDNKDFFCVKPSDFERQIKYLRENNFNVISLDKLVWHLENNNFPPKTVALTFDDGYEDNFTSAFPILKKYNFPATIFLETAVLGREKTNKSGVIYKMLKWGQIKEMKNSGIFEFGAHTLNHPKLSQLNLMSVEKEIIQSKEILEDMLGKKCVFFAYPFGDFNEQTIIIAKKNFKAVFTVKNGTIKYGDNLMELKRNSIDSAVSFSQFKGIVKFGKI